MNPPVNLKIFFDAEPFFTEIAAEWSLPYKKNFFKLSDNKFLIDSSYLCEYGNGDPLIKQKRDVNET